MIAIGACPWSFDGVVHGRRSLASLCEAAATVGFASVEVPWTARLDLTVPSGGFAVPASSVATLASRRASLLAPDAAGRGAGSRAAEAMVEAARALGASSVSLTPGAVPAGWSEREAVDLLVDETRPLRDTAAASGIALLFENLPGHCLASPSAMERLLERAPDVRFCLDLGNALIHLPDARAFEEWLDTFGPYAGKIHVSDARVVEGALEPCEIGRGAVPYAALAERVRALARHATLFVETPPVLAPTPEGEAVRLARALRAARDLVEEAACA